MAGGIYLDRERYWSCAGWLFESVLNALERSVSSSTLSVALREVIVSGVGLIDVASLSEADRAELFRAIREDLEGVLADELSCSDQIDSPEVLEHIGSLIDLLDRS